MDLTTIRLVKFLYLADLFQARTSPGTILTGFPWALINFGPYCSESLQAIDEARNRSLISARAYQSKYSDEDKYVYSAHLSKEPKLGNELSLYVASKLKAAIKRWGDDTQGLLDFTYFETEPMSNAKPYEILDFAKTRLEEPVEDLKINPLRKKTLKKGHEILEALRTRTFKNKERSTPLDTGPKDEAYFQAVAYSENEALTQGLCVTANFGDLEQPQLDKERE
jgi:hypothetical protein